MTNASYGNESNADLTSNVFSDTHANTFQRHPLRFPMCQCPCQRQRKLLPHSLGIMLRLRINTEDRHALAVLRAQPRKKGPDIWHRIAFIIKAHFARQVHVLEVHNDTKRRTLARIHRSRISTSWPNKAFHNTNCTVHQASLRPQVSRQQHARPLTQSQNARQPEVIIIHQIRTLRLVS